MLDSFDSFNNCGGRSFHIAVLFCHCCKYPWVSSVTASPFDIDLGIYIELSLLRCILWKRRLEQNQAKRHVTVLLPTSYNVFSLFTAMTALRLWMTIPSRQTTTPPTVTMLMSQPKCRIQVKGNKHTTKTRRPTTRQITLYRKLVT